MDLMDVLDVVDVVVADGHQQHPRHPRRPQHQLEGNGGEGEGIPRPPDVMFDEGRWWCYS